MTTLLPTLDYIDKEKEMAKSLYSYIYHNVHSRPYSEYRHNIQLFPLFNVPKTNVFSVASMSIALPGTGRWFLYTIEVNAFMMVKLPIMEKWVNVVDFCNSTGVDIRFILHNSGKLINRGWVYILKNPKADNYIFAIKKDALSRLLDSNENPEHYLTIDTNIYYHHPGENFKIESYMDNSRDSLRTAFYTAIYAVRKDPIIVYIDGVEISPYSRSGAKVLNVNSIPVDCVGEIVVDSSIIGSFEVDVSDSTTYRDAKGQVKVLCHVPKWLNPSNIVLNHRVCDFYIHPGPDSTDRYVSGYYYNRFNTDPSLSTVTHNDFGFVKRYSDDYSVRFVDQNHYTIKVYVRDHKKGLILRKEANHLLSLYQLSDEEIQNHLITDQDHPYWCARTLEQAEWVKMVDDYLTGVDTNKFPQMINALGYVNSANAICGRVKDITITNELSRKFYVSIPICYMGIEDLVCHVFKDGVRLDEDYFKFSQEKQYMLVEINDKLDLPVGTRLTLEIFEGHPYRCRNLVILPNNEISLAVGDDEFLVYHVVTLTEENSVADIELYHRYEVDASYKPFTESELNAFVSTSTVDDTNIAIFKNTGSVPMNILVVSKNAYQKIYGVERHLKEFNYDIVCSHLLKVKAELFPVVEDGEIENVEGQYTTIPYINTNKNKLVYLNGRELIKGLDYQDYEIKTSKNYTCGQFIIIQNADYLRLVSNTIEVFSINEEITHLDTGFLTEGNTESVASHIAYFTNIGSVFVDGKLARDADSRYYVSVDKFRAGASYKIRACIPQCLKSILDKYDQSTLDIEEKVRAYVESKLDKTLVVAPITRSYHIYSTFLQTVTEKVLRGQIKLNMGMSDSKLMEALKPYTYMMDFDLAFNKDNIVVEDPYEFVKTPSKGLDFRFIDVLPSYRIERLEDSDLDITEKRPIMIISGSNRLDLNGNYICINPGIEYMKTRPVVHMNENAYKQWNNLNGDSVISHKDGYWRLYDEDGVECYRAKDTLGIIDIWNLDWEPTDASLEPLSFVTKTVEVNTSNEFRIHRLSFTHSIEEYAVLKRIANLYLTKDLAKDGTYER